jgi:acyl-CoA dehydrogenase
VRRAPGKLESGRATEREALFQRIVTPIAKLTTAKQAVAVTSETLECFGGAGYVEDTGLPKLLRDAQVLPIWEGTTNVLSLDTLRAMAKEGTFQAFTAEVNERLGRARDAQLAPCVSKAQAALGHATEWLGGVLAKPALVEAGARRFAMTLGRTLQLTMLAEHAQWTLEQGKGKRALAAARRYAANGVDLISDADPSDSALLA